MNRVNQIHKIKAAGSSSVIRLLGSSHSSSILNDYPLACVLALAFFLMLAPTLAFAQTGGGQFGGGGAGGSWSEGPTAPIEDGVGRRAESMGCGRDSDINCVINSFDGDPLDFRYDKSPITFNSKEVNGRATIYPEFSTNTNFDTPVIGALELGFDKEIIKSLIPALQSTLKTGDEFLNNNFKTQSMLDIYNKARSVAASTLGYMDPAVDAGIAMMEQQKGDSLSTEINSLTSRMLYRMSNPEVDRIMRDTDEKTEYCLSQVGAQQSTVSDRIKFDFEAEECKVCGDTYDYSFCNCCSQQLVELNKTTEDAQGSVDGAWSLVDAIFFGLKSPKGGDLGEYTRAVVQSFKDMYGDIVYVYDPETKSNKKSTRVPSLSPAQKIQILRDGPKQSVGGSSGETDVCEVPTDQSFLSRSTNSGVQQFLKRDANKGELACAISGVRVIHGIYPALKHILENWPPKSQSDTDALREYWQEASLAVTLTGRDIQNMLALSPYGGTGIPKGQPLGGKLTRWLIAYSDASAFAALKRFHFRIKSIALNHLMGNQNSTPREQAEFRALIDRVEELLALSENDVNSNLHVETQLVALSVQGDQKEVANITSTAAGAMNAISNAAQGMGVTAFGGNPSFKAPPAAAGN